MGRPTTRTPLAPEDWAEFDADTRCIAVHIEVLAAKVGKSQGNRVAERGYRIARDLAEYRRAVRRLVSGDLNIAAEEGE